MQRALKQANDAANLGEVPVGAVLTLNDEIIAEDHNRSISLNDPDGLCHTASKKKCGEWDDGW